MIQRYITTCKRLLAAVLLTATIICTAYAASGKEVAGPSVTLHATVRAAFRMKQQAWSLADAETEMQAFGFNDVWVSFRKFIRGYGKDLGNLQSKR